MSTNATQFGDVQIVGPDTDGDIEITIWQGGEETYDYLRHDEAVALTADLARRCGLVVVDPALLRTLADALDAEFECEAADDEAVSEGDKGPSPITFGMIRALRKLVGPS